MRIFTAGLSTESNTYSPMPTGFDDFEIVRASDLSPVDPDFGMFDLFGMWRNNALARGDDFILSLAAFAQPSGVTVRSVYETLRDEILLSLKQTGPVDVVLLFLHGAMVAEGYEDCEGDIITRVREIVGPDVTIAVELDLHCHLTELMVAQADIIITFKEYPHIDVNDRAEELFDLAVRAQSGELRPTMAMFDCKMVGIYPTSEPALRRFVDHMSEVEQEDGVLSVSFGHGFPAGDVTEAGCKMLVVTDNDLPLAEELAEKLGQEIYDLRHEIGFKTVPMAEALSRALASDRSPVVVADQADNAGGGAPGDATFALRWLLENKAQNVAMAIFYDPEVVRLAKSAGEGAKLKVSLGGKLGPTSGDPVDLDVAVLAVKDDYSHRFPQGEGKPVFLSVGDVVALRAEGIDLIVSSKRGQCFSPCIFEDLGIDPTTKQLLIPKSMQHFYGAFAPIASEVIYMASFGAMQMDVTQISYEHMTTADKFPWKEACHE
ncbi:M81 family metallopeptidase [Paremcibacter congregatus]|uniref:Microcystinase C n=1 Tax=Paremcibacter congregatus TaxID=2043170 RepID=A0A2G4YVK5_9PROT|nr:M81 family metallopeptidase [Paremcibacter congregatus]PHZ85476.1 microcystin LR degradation protein MlrC-like protein [Paremcibacter congregatus]QDE28027.1 M81 family metallopeptidase [Paremcibacter congregatus]